jgi:hypothetical protein
MWRHADPSATGGKLSKIDHFVSKAEVAQYAKSLGLPTTLFLPGVYASNLPGQILVKTENGYIVATPADSDAQLPFFDAENDTGKFVKAIFLNREKTLGKEVYGATKYYTPLEISETFEKVFPVDGKGIQYVQVKGDDFVNKLKSYGMSQKIGEEILENMYLFNKEYGYYAGADLAESHSVCLFNMLKGGKLMIRSSPKSLLLLKNTSSLTPCTRSSSRFRSFSV